jgi:hypothetical protein
MSISASRVFFASWCCLIVLLWSLIGSAVGVPRLLKLRKHHNITPGLVIKTIPYSHGKVVVRYMVNGSEYVREFAPYPFETGDELEVFYWPDDPSISEISDPTDRLVVQIPFAVGATILLSVPFVISFVAFKRRGVMFWPPSLAVDPRVTSTFVSVGVIAGRVSSIMLKRFDALRAAGDLLMIAASVVFLHATWARRLKWGELLKSKSFWSAVLLGVLGNLLTILYK